MLALLLPVCAVDVGWKDFLCTVAHSSSQVQRKLLNVDGENVEGAGRSGAVHFRLRSQPGAVVEKS